MDNPTRARQEIERKARALPVHTQDKIAADQLALNRAEIFDPQLAKLYLDDLVEVPDSVKNYPEGCQAAYLVTFNRWLAKTGDVSKAMRAGMKAVRTKLDQLAADRRNRKEKRELKDSSNEARNLKEFTLDRMTRGKRVAIVVP